MKEKQKRKDYVNYMVECDGNIYPNPRVAARVLGFSIGAFYSKLQYRRYKAKSDSRKVNAENSTIDIVLDGNNLTVTIIQH